MLDPCSTSSYISEEAAEELELHGQELNLTIAGTGGVEVKTCSNKPRWYILKSVATPCP